MKQTQETKFPLSVLYLFFFSSGFAALLYQIVWLKYLNLLFGSTTFATAAVLSAFMFGLSMGSHFSRKFPVLFRSPLRTYGLLEIGIGLFALSFPFLYSHLKLPFSFFFNLLGPSTIWYNFLTFLVAFLVLALPTSLMGATMPVLGHWVISRETIFKKSGSLYSVNAAGAVAGILCSAFIFIPSLGLSATITVGVLINLLVGVICFLTKSSNKGIAGSAVNPAQRNFLLFLYAVSGLIAIGYEVIWTRILVLHLGSSVYAYAMMLSVFLLGISAGSYLSGKILHKQNVSSAFGWIQVLWAFSILIQILQFSFFSDVLFWMSKPFREIKSSTQFIILFSGAGQILLIPTILSGALFPVVVTALTNLGNTIKDAVSLSYSYNTIGGIFGSLFTGFALIPWFGTQDSLLILAVGNLILGCTALLQIKSRHSKWLRMALPAGVFAIAAFWIQSSNHILERAGIFQMEKNEALMHLEEDYSATISVERRHYLNLPYDSLSVNGVNVAGTSPNLIAIQKLQGHLPLILFGPKKPKSVLHIGFGSGGTAYSVSLYPDTKIQVVELSRGIVRNADQYFRSVNHGIVQSGKLRFIYFDGRSFLQNTQEQFDIILSDSIHPRYSGNGSLYTRDYYQLVYNRLKEGGVHSQWIPLYSVLQKNMKEILAAFHDIFPETYIWYINSTINPYIIVTGKKQSKGISWASIQESFTIPAVRADLQEVGVHDPYYLLDHFLFGPDGLRKYTEFSDFHSDDLLTVEYESSRILDKNLSWWLNFAEQCRYREKIDPYLTNAASWDQAVSDRFFGATTENLKGQSCFIRGRLKEAKFSFGKAALINPPDREPFEYYNIRF